GNDGSLKSTLEGVLQKGHLQAGLEILLLGVDDQSPGLLNTLDDLSALPEDLLNTVSRLLNLDDIGTLLNLDLTDIVANDEANDKILGGDGILDLGDLLGDDGLLGGLGLLDLDGLLGNNGQLDLGLLDNLLDSNGLLGLNSLLNIGDPN